MAYTRLTAFEKLITDHQERQARKEARLEAKAQELFFENLFWTIEERTEELVTFEAEEARYTHEEAMMMVKLAYEAGKAAS